MNIFNRTIVEFKIDEEEIQIICRKTCPPEIMNQALLQMNQYCNELIAKKQELEKEQSQEIQNPETEVV